MQLVTQIRRLQKVKTLSEQPNQVKIPKVMTVVKIGHQKKNGNMRPGPGPPPGGGSATARRTCGFTPGIMTTPQT